MKEEETLLNDKAPGKTVVDPGPSSFIPHPSSLSRMWRASWLGRKAQTTVEYMLVTACLTVVFFVIYRILQLLLTRQFRMGGIIILKMYTQPYN